MTMTESMTDVESTRAGLPTFECAPVTKTGKPPVVLLHGAFADHHTFRHWLPRLAAAGHLAIAPARRGRVGFGPDRAEGLTSRTISRTPWVFSTRSMHRRC